MTIRFVMKSGLVLGATVLMQCSTSPLELNTDDLNSLLSISNLNKRLIPDQSDPPGIVGLEVEADVINVGQVIVKNPFKVTWTLLGTGGDRLGSASTELAGNFSPGGTRHFSLTLSFPATVSLEGFRDVVTFDLVSPSG